MVGKKKRGHPDIEELLARPWCYYCTLQPSAMAMNCLLTLLQVSVISMI
jgi:hypothetical protein